MATRCIALGVALSATTMALAQGPRESDYYRILTAPIPAKVAPEAGAIELLPDGRLAVATRRGDVYLVDGFLDDDLTGTQWTLFARGLHEVLGLAYRDGWLYAVQRGEVSRMKDSNGSGRADIVESVGGDWELSGDYHEYAFGSKFDANGDLWVVLCLTGSFSSDVPFRGWCMKVSHDGVTTPVCSGLRSPGGIGANAIGDMFYTDNQGPWNGTCSLKHLKPGSFQGHPIGNRWYDAPGVEEVMGKRPLEPQSGSRTDRERKRIAQLTPPAILFPYKKMGQSASGIAVDHTQGKFGPFHEQLFVGDQTFSTVMRCDLEQVNGVYQGACYPFREGLSCGAVSLLMTDDGSLVVGGSNRGWGSRGNSPHSLERLQWTGKTPFEILRMRLLPDGFELTLTQPVDPATAAAASTYQMQTYTYIYQEQYGSPEVDHTTPTIKAVEVSEDRLRVRLRIEGLQVGHVHEFQLPQLRSEDGRPLLHAEAYYTLNELAR